ncbi:MAG: DUF2185 domain-containing protein [Clostridiaceae bacterium]|nr:DUF2185 domain-containing protein [Clostridiaceae bacterium]
MLNIFKKKKNISSDNCNNGCEERLAALKDKLEHIKEAEKQETTKEEFYLLLAAIPSYFEKIPVFDFNMDLTQEGIDGIKDHLKKVNNIHNKDTALDALAMNKHNGCGRNYDDFMSFWNGNPAFDINELNEEGRAFFISCRAFAHNFYRVIGENGFTAWDVGESINIVRDCFVCGYLDKELCDAIIDDFAFMAFQKYHSFEEYALSYIAGGSYFMFRETGGNINHAVNMFNRLYDAANELFFNEDFNVWAEYEWYKGAESPFFKNMDKIEKLIDSDLQCIVSNRISIDGCEIGYMYKEETSGEHPDSGWRFFAGDEDDEYLNNSDNMHLFPLNTICNYDKGIIPLLDSPINTAYSKDEAGEFAVEKLRDDNINKLCPINFSEYLKYIVVKNTSEDYVLSYMKEFGELTLGDKKIYEFIYYILNRNDNNFIIIKCPENMDFYNFHNLAEWFYGCGEDKNNEPDLSCNICFNKVDKDKNYYAVVRDDEWKDTIEGIFNNGTRFSIYLPEAFKGDDVLIDYNNLHYTTVESYLNSLGLEVEDLISIEKKEFIRAEFEMAVE